MGGNNSPDRARSNESLDAKPLIQDLLQSGYYSPRLIADELGENIKTVQKVKAEMALPGLLAELEERAEESKGTELGEAAEEVNQPPTRQTDPPSPTDKPDNWRELTENDLEEKVLDRVGVINLILTWLKEAGISGQDDAQVGGALDEAQIDASTEHRRKGRKLPIQLRRDSSLMLHRIALWKLGKPGRGGSSKYRVIKGCLTKETAQP
jgi:hypothetical protein